MYTQRQRYIIPYLSDPFEGYNFRDLLDLEEVKNLPDHQDKEAIGLADERSLGRWIDLIRKEREQFIEVDLEHARERVESAQRLGLLQDAEVNELTRLLDDFRQTVVNWDRFYEMIAYSIKHTPQDLRIGKAVRGTYRVGVPNVSEQEHWTATILLRMRSYIIEPVSELVADWNDLVDKLKQSTTPVVPFESLHDMDRVAPFRSFQQ